MICSSLGMMSNRVMIRGIFPGDQRYRDANVNLRTQLTRIIQRAGLTPWPKLIHNLRSTQQTELAEQFRSENQVSDYARKWFAFPFNYDPVTGALGVAQEHSLPILIIMFNNQGYLSQKSGVPRYYPNGWAVKTNHYAGLNIAPCPDYATIAKAFDGYGERVEEPSDVRKAVERGLRSVAAGQLALIDVRLKPVENTLERDG